eukprot:SAG11_NODE_190_length_12980_cov_11.633802_11_plen_37_part_00
MLAWMRWVCVTKWVETGDTVKDTTEFQCISNYYSHR